MTDDKKKLPTPIEFKSKLLSAAKGEGGKFTNAHGQPSNEIALREWKNILGLMNENDFSISDKISWLSHFIDEVKGTAVPISFARLMSHISGQYKDLSKVDEDHQLLKDNDGALQESKKAVEPWDQLDDEVQNRITTFLSGKRKKNKPCYRFLLSMFELNRTYIDHGDAQAVIDLAEKNESYNSIEIKPDGQSQRKQIKEYMNRYNSPE